MTHLEFALVCLAVGLGSGVIVGWWAYAWTRHDRLVDLERREAFLKAKDEQTLALLAKAAETRVGSDPGHPELGSFPCWDITPKSPLMVKPEDVTEVFAKTRKRNKNTITGETVLVPVISGNPAIIAPVKAIPPVTPSRHASPTRSPLVGARISIGARGVAGWGEPQIDPVTQTDLLFLNSGEWETEQPASMTDAPSSSSVVPAGSGSAD